MSALSLLPCDILSDILSRLSVKTLCKFCCVSKSWCALISDCNFRELHHRRSEQNPRLLLIFSDTKKLQLTSLDKNRNLIKDSHVSLNYPFFLATSTCLDLVCLHHFETYGELSLLNPATTSITHLPKTTNTDRHYGRVGFGYIPSAKEYKVLCMYEENDSEEDDDEGEDHIGCEIITVRVRGNTIDCDKRWREGKEPPEEFESYCNCIFVNGFFHLMSNYHSLEKGIARFDLEREEWSVLSPPQQLLGFHTSGTYIFCMGELSGEICIRHLREGNLMDLWLLKEHEGDGDWVKQYAIDLNPLSIRNRELSPVVPLAIEEDGRILMLVQQCMLVHYDPQGKGFQVIMTEKSSIRTSFYVESFMALGNS